MFSKVTNDIILSKFQFFNDYQYNVNSRFESSSLSGYQSTQNNNNNNDNNGGNDGDDNTENDDNDYNVEDDNDVNLRRKIEFRNLKTWNLVMGFIHLISFICFIILFIVYYDKIYPSMSYTDFAYVNGNGSSRALIVDSQNVNSYNLLWVLLPFPLITCLFHFFIATFGFKNYIFILYGYGIQYYRWIEYSITSGLMIWVIYTLSGGTHILLGFVLVMLNCNMNLFGFIMEYVNSNKRLSNVKANKLINAIQATNYEYNDNKLACWFIKNKKPDVLEFRRTLSTETDVNVKTLSFMFQKNNVKKERVVWWPFIVGFINFLIVWLIIFLYFFYTLAKSQFITDIPWFVWTIDIGLFFQFLLFGLVMLFHFLARSYHMQNMSIPWLLQPFKLRFYYEIMYQILSLISKTFLVWFLFGGIIGQM